MLPPTPLRAATSAFCTRSRHTIKSRPVLDRPIRVSAFLCVFAVCVTGTSARSFADDQPQASESAADSKPPSTDSQSQPATGYEKAEQHWQTVGWPLMETFCIECHNEDFQEAELDLSRFSSLAGMKADEEVVRKVLNMVAFGAMPPEDYDLPSDEERKTLQAVLDQTHYEITCDLRPKAGNVTARRLNRAEYNNSIRDLFGLDLHPADAFPSDEVGGGFDNNGDVLSLSPLQIEKYFDAAELVASQAIFDPDQFERFDTENAPDQLIVVGDSQTGSFNGRFLDEKAWAWTEFKTQHPGDYRLRIRAGASIRQDELAMLAVYDTSGLLIAKMSFKYFGGSGGADSEEDTITLSAGTHRVIMVPLESDPDSPEVKQLVVGKSKFADLDQLNKQTIAAGRKQFGQPLSPGRVDEDSYPFMIRSVSLQGSGNPPKSLYPPRHNEIVKRIPARRGDRYRDVDDAAVECLQPLMRRAFRMPISREEVLPYAKLAEAEVSKGKNYHQGLQVAISAILMSPRFLFRIETPPDEWSPEKTDQRSVEVPLTQHQLATRLAYFLWSSTPDDTLLAAADDNKLHGDFLDAQVRRMIADPRGDALADQFAAQWLGLRNLDGHVPDEERFGGFRTELLPMMIRETEVFFLHLLRNNERTADLLTADYSFLNQDLAEFYGVSLGSGDAEFRRTSLRKTPRRGVLGHASVLTLTSDTTRTSPVKRGKWILENIMGTAPPEPPSDVPELEEAGASTAHLTLRKQLEIHRDNPSCAACHRVMDQLGFGLENFDAVGRFREKDGDQPIDSSGVLPGGRSFKSATELSNVLGKSEREAFAKTVTERLLGFALGRELAPADRCNVDEIVTTVSDEDYRLIDIVTNVVRSRPFQYYQWRLGENQIAAAMTEQR